MCRGDNDKLSWLKLSFFFPNLRHLILKLKRSAKKFQLECGGFYWYQRWEHSRSDDSRVLQIILKRIIFKDGLHLWMTSQTLLLVLRVTSQRIIVKMNFSSTPHMMRHLFIYGKCIIILYLLDRNIIFSVHPFASFMWMIISIKSQKNEKITSRSEFNANFMIGTKI